jgi:hypothetical protein
LIEMSNLVCWPPPMSVFPVGVIEWTTPCASTPDAWSVWASCARGCRAAGKGLGRG